MYNLEIIFALFTVKFLNIGFDASQSINKKMIFFKNVKGNSIYMSLENNGVDICVYRQSARCYREVVNNDTNIDIIINEIKTKLKL